MDEACHTRQRVCTQSGRVAHRDRRRKHTYTPPLSPQHLTSMSARPQATIKLAKLGTETLAERRPWYNSAALNPSGPKHWPPGRPAHDRQQMSMRASPDCTG